MLIAVFFILKIICIKDAVTFRNYSKNDIIKFRNEVRQMFQHAYDGYLKFASDYDELRPLTCDGINTWGSYSLTLIDALDTLAVMGNYTEFNRVVNLLVKKSNFDIDINVSVFETNIRIVGGLLSAHLLSHQTGLELDPGWPCSGPLLNMAEDVVKRLLPAFDTETGMPFGTVNLKYGVPAAETPITCTAGIGTFIVEFGTLSRLTGNPIYEEIALNALYSLWKYKSPIGLFGNHIDVQTGQWTAQDAGIGAGVDSYYEYLVKGSLMLNRPDLLEMFHEARKGIEKYLKNDDWYIWASMNKGQITLPVFQSLDAYWPGVLSIIGDTNAAMRTILNYHSVWKQYGFLPEFYNIGSGEAAANRESYPLRPELIESIMYLHRSTSDPILLEMGVDILKSIQHSAKTSCGYSTIKNVRDHTKENRMESFFLAETTKYLYLLFDTDNFLHNQGKEGTIFETPNGMCIIEAGGYIFNTEAHPIDPSALRCCHEMKNNNLFKDFNINEYKGEVLAIKERKNREQTQEKILKKKIEDDNEKVGKKTIVEITESLKNIITSKNINKIKSDILKSNFLTENQSLSENMKKYLNVSKNESLEDAKNDSMREFHEIPQTILNHYEKFLFLLKKNNFFLSDGNRSLEDRNLLQSRFHEAIKFEINFDVLMFIYKFAKVENYSVLHILESLQKILKFFGEGKFGPLIKHDMEIFNILMERQTIYESFIAFNRKLKNIDIVELLEMLENPKLFSKEYKKILNNEIESSSLNISIVFKPHIFEYIEIYTEYYLEPEPEKQKYLLEQIDKIFTSFVAFIDEKTNITDMNVNDDLIVIDKKLKEESNIGVGTVELVPLIQNSTNESSIENKIKLSIPSSNTVKIKSENTGNSDFSNLISSFLNKLSVKKKFDQQILLDKIRAKGMYQNVTQNFEIFSCYAQPFIQKLCFYGQVY